MQRTRFVFRPRDGGLVLRFRARRGQRLWLTRFLAAPQGRFTSGMEAHLQRERRLVVARTRTVEVRYPGAPPAAAPATAAEQATTPA